MGRPVLVGTSTNRLLPATPPGELLTIRLLAESSATPSLLVRLTLVITCDAVLAEVKGWVKTLMLLPLVVANRQPALLKARLSTEVEVPFLNVADAEAEAVIGPLKIEMLPPEAPTATLPAESTATAETSLAVGSDRVADGAELVTGSAN